MIKGEFTNIQISAKLWKYLNNRKTKPGESFDDVIERLIKEVNING